jgi:hypothetical protein
MSGRSRGVRNEEILHQAIGRFGSGEASGRHSCASSQPHRNLIVLREYGSMKRSYEKPRLLQEHVKLQSVTAVAPASLVPVLVE